MKRIWKKTMLLFLVINVLLTNLMVLRVLIPKAEAAIQYTVWDKYNAFYGYTEPPDRFLNWNQVSGWAGPTGATWDPFNNTWIFSGYAMGGKGYSLYDGRLMWNAGFNIYSKNISEGGRAWIKDTLVQPDIVAPDGTYPDGYNPVDGYFYVKHAAKYYYKIYDVIKQSEDDYYQGPNLIMTDAIVNYPDNYSGRCFYYNNSGEYVQGWCVKDRLVDKLYSWTVYNALGHIDNTGKWDYWDYTGIAGKTAYNSYTFNSTTGTYASAGSLTTTVIYDKPAYTVSGNTFCKYFIDSFYYGNLLGNCKTFPDKYGQYKGSSVLRNNVVALDGDYPDNGLGVDGNWWVKGPARPSVEIVSPLPTQMFSDFNTAMIPTVRVSNPGGGTLNLAIYIDSEATPRDSKVISNTATAQTLGFNAIELGALAEGSHIMKFTVSYGSESVENTVDFTVDKSVPTIGSITAALTDTTIQISGSASDSISGLSTDPYRYSVDSNTSAWIASPQYTQSNLMPNTVYNVKFEAKDNVGHIVSQTQSVRTKAQVPTLAVSQAMETSLDISFNDSNPSITQYQVKAGEQYVSATGALTTAPTWIIPTNKKVKATGLSPNTSYSFQAKARNELGEETAYSLLVGGTTLASSPSPITTELAQRSIKLNWPATSGVASYDVEADGVMMNNGTSTSFSHNGLAPNTQHNYRVRANNAGGTGNWSYLISKFTLPDPPALPTNIQTEPLRTEITVSWDIVARAESYDVEVDGVVIDNGNQITYVHQGLQPLTDHTYRIRAKNPGGISEWSQPVVKKTLPNPPSTPDNVTAELFIHQVTVNWSRSEGADAYEIEADGLIIENGDKTAYLHEGLDALSGHTYRVRAKNIGGKSPWSAPLDITTHPEIPDIPTNIMTTAEENSITATWYKVPHAASYEVEIDGVSVINVTNNQFVHSELTPDSRYTYRVRAKNISGISEWSSPITLSTFPSGSDSNISLTNIAAVVTNRFITISWDTVAPDAKYDIEVDGVLMDNGDDTIYNHTGLKANEFHTYKIRLKNEDHPGEWVAILSLSTLPDPPDAPTDIEAFATNNSIEIRWQKNTGVTGYDIEIDGKTMDAGSDSSYIHDELSSGTAHTYRVRAKNETGVTAWSPAIVKSTTSPTYMVNGTKDTNFDLSLLASNVQDFSELTYVVTYDPNQLEAVDLFGFTPKLDLPVSGKISGSNLEVTYTAGKITFKFIQNVIPGTSWSGEIATIVFKSKIDGQSMIDVVVE